ncbi:PREDICTED: dnaJ homolog subfamily C member 13 [Amphimedon queenslandica]|nr:PREDICTED: dnaJ homolog subfamily C member 13 [Amphimedon queenslandica]|eukprot:XP_019858666.1 PREDICTED: dnaJ homolog subfamily C member 13 [Amphimedon queenslandica]
MYLVEQRDELLREVQTMSQNNLGYFIGIRKDPITQQDFLNRRFGKYSDDDSITSLTEFPVQKHSQRHSEPVQRTLALSENCLLERDPSTYAIVTLKPLCSVFSLIRYPENPQNFAVEYNTGQIRRYTSADRDSLLCSILDGVRATGNNDVCVKMKRTILGQRLGPMVLPVEEEVESMYLKLLGTTPPGPSFMTAVEEFNANIGYSGLNHAVTQEGLFTENKEKLITQALLSLLSKDGDQSSLSAYDLECQFHSLRRLVASKAGYSAFTELPNFRDSVGKKVVRSLKRKDDGITHACVDFLCALMQPMHDNFDLKQEQLNKSSLLSSKAFIDNLLEVLRSHIKLGTGALVISALLDFITFAICPPYSETTPGAMFDSVLELTAALNRGLFKLFQHPSLAIVKAAGLIMKAIIEEGNEDIAKRMQELALAEGALPRHMHTALFTSSADNRLLTHRQLSRHLIKLWITGNPTANALLLRMLPLGLVQYLESSEKAPEDTDRMHIRDNLKAVQLSRKKLNVVESTLLHWRARLRSKPQPTGQPVTLRKRRENIKSEANWTLFYYKFTIDHATSSLIWNYKTREELREALETEIRSFTIDKDLSGNAEISWNHVEFEVRYESLSDEIKIGDYYLRLLLDEGGSTKFVKPLEFFNDLYHRFLLSPKPAMKAMCLQAMAIVYGQCYEEIGPFNDTPFIVHKLERCDDKEERDRLLMFIDKLVFHKKNIKLFLDAHGMKILVDLLAMAHLHTTRAYVPTQTNVIEAAPDQGGNSEKEWYFGNREREREGPYSFEEMKELWTGETLHPKSRCWAQGMEGWKPLDQIAQLKWNLMATGTPLLNESEVAALILNMLIRMCNSYPTRDIDDAVIRPLPRAKRMLSEPTALPHLVQLLLTFDPSLVDKVVTLLNNIMEDNPQLPRLFMSGVFFFIMMYTGSNILPIAKFLQYSHTKQSFRPDEQATSDIMLRSILGQLLPEAMVHYLENHGPEKFSSIFLGEFDTPEAIWNAEMRRLMIEKIAVHIADFSPRLRSNTKSTYQYCAIPIIQYPQLENELFCNIYYLRHLCDTVKFPDWPVKDPVKVLKDVLLEWKKEVDKKPPEMSVSQAYETLGLEVGVGGHEESKIRKSYFKLAQKYHPDKNPEGRSVFEAVNKAYEFLCSKSAHTKVGPDPERIVLLLRTQSILFTRCADTLRPYKYAGYPMLIKTIERETGDEDLFSKSAPILTAASEVAYHTMNNSALNSEELCRENGIPILQAAFTRCVNVISESSKEDDMSVQVCSHIAKCYRVSSQFEACRESIVETPNIVKDLCRIMYYKNLPRLNVIATETASSFAVDEWLQTQLLQAGVLWHVLQYIFNYDYTLDESGVETNESTNQQEVANNLARLSLVAAARLGGFKLAGSEGTPYNKVIQSIFSNLLTPYLAKLISRNTTNELLKILNSNTENPYLIWDNRTRAELTDYLLTQQKSMIRSGECDMSFGEDFKYSVLKDELVIGEVYIRVYNEQPTFVLEDPKGFATAVLDFIGSNAQYLHSLMAMTASDIDKGQHAVRLKNVEMALEALYNVLHANPGVEIQCMGHFKLLFSLLGVQGANKVQMCALQVVSAVTGNKSCVSNIADSNVLQYLMIVLHSLPASHSLVLEVLQALTSHTQIVKESIQKGALIYLLNLFCNSQNSSVREQTANLFAKMITDKLVGPRVRIVLGKFLPYIFMDAMRDSAEAAVIMFENTQENPELIWNDESREKVSDMIQTMTNEFFLQQKDNPEIIWKLPEDFAVVYSQIQGEVEVGGVFLRLFIAQPNWVLRKPKEFLIALLEKFSVLIQSHSPDGEVLETVTQATVCLFSAQPAMADQVPPLGHLPRIFERMFAENNSIPKSCVEVVNVLSGSGFCVRNMSKIDTAMKSLLAAMKKRPDCVNSAAESISKMMEEGSPELVHQALEHGMVAYLLELLDSALTECDKPSATKAIIAESLKLMAKDLANGERVNELLDSSKVWSAYKDQKHDLFITDTPIAGYLTAGSVGGVAGYLTAGTSIGSGGSGAPPPLEPPEDVGANEDD